MPDVAVIMAAHNEEKFIERALRSCLRQSAPPDSFEVVVVDDGSSDATARIAQSFGPRVTVLANGTQLGLPTAFNHGLKAAHTRYVVRVDAGRLRPRGLHPRADALPRLNPHMDAVACDYFTVDSTNNTSST